MKNYCLFLLLFAFTSVVFSYSFQHEWDSEKAFALLDEEIQLINQIKSNTAQTGPILGGPVVGEIYSFVNDDFVRKQEDLAKLRQLIADRLTRRSAGRDVFSSNDILLGVDDTPTDLTIKLNRVLESIEEHRQWIKQIDKMLNDQAI